MRGWGPDRCSRASSTPTAAPPGLPGDVGGVGSRVLGGGAALGRTRDGGCLEVRIVVRRNGKWLVAFFGAFHGFDVVQVCLVLVAKVVAFLQNKTEE